jgi:hypothetical protein
MQGAPVPQQPPPQKQKPAPKAAAAQKPKRHSSDDDDDDEDDAGAAATKQKTLPPLLRFGAQPPDFVPRASDIVSAQKLTKTAFSALNFDDTTTAARDLCAALKHLTGIDYTVVPRK